MESSKTDIETRTTLEDPNWARLRDLLNLSYLNHWHIVPMQRTHSVSDHSYRVVAISLYLCDKLKVDGDHRLKVLEWAVMHDGDESYSGDIPSPAKNDQMKQALTQLRLAHCSWYQHTKDTRVPAAEGIVKVADLIETYTWWKMHGPVEWNHPWYTHRDTILFSQLDKQVRRLSFDWKELKHLPEIVSELISNLLPKGAAHGQYGGM